MGIVIDCQMHVTTALYVVHIDCQRSGRCPDTIDKERMTAVPNSRIPCIGKATWKSCSNAADCCSRHRGDGGDHAWRRSAIHEKRRSCAQNVAEWLLMLLVAVTSFFIHKIELWGLYSPFASLWTIVSVGLAVYYVRIGNINATSR